MGNKVLFVMDKEKRNEIAQKMNDLDCCPEIKEIIGKANSVLKESTYSFVDGSFCTSWEFVLWKAYDWLVLEHEVDEKKVLESMKDAISRKIAECIQIGDQILFY